MTNGKKEITDKVGEDYCFLEKYVNKNGIKNKEFVFIEFIDEVESNS